MKDFHLYKFLSNLLLKIFLIIKMNSLLLLELEADMSDMLRFKANYLRYKNRFSFYRRRNRLYQTYWFNEYMKQREYIRIKYDVVKLHNL